MNGERPEGFDIDDAASMLRYALNHPEESGYLNRDWIVFVDFVRWITHEDWNELERVRQRGPTVTNQ